MERTIRHSKKREAILSAIRSTTCHPSAEWVYQALKPDFPDLSLGTVYRNLIFFQTQGDIQSVGVISGQERFDGTTTPHSHFVCTRCGAIIDLDGFEPDQQVARHISEQYALLVERQEHTFFGACQTCMQHNSNEEDL